MSPPRPRPRRPSVTVTHETRPKGPPRAPPRRDPLQSAYGNSVANTIVFTDPLVITASPPKPADTITFEPEVITARPPPAAPSKTITFEPAVITARPPPAAPSKTAVPSKTITFEPEVITARAPAQPEKPPQTGGDGVIVLAPVTIYGRAPPREAAAKDPAPAAKVGKDGEVVFEPDVIVGRAPGVSVEAGEGPAQTGPLGKMAPDDKRPPSPTDLKHVDPDSAPKPKPKAMAGEEGEAVVPEGEDEESERKPGEPISEDDKVSEEGLPKPAAVAQQAAGSQPAAAAESNGVADLAAWRSRVSAATAATPRPTLGSAPVASVTVISSTGRNAGARHRAGGAAVAKDAKKAVRPPPEVPKQLPPPPPTPVPAADKLITDASDKEMPEQKLPVLEQRAPDAAVPTMDTELASDIGSKIEIPPPEPKPELAPGEKKPLDAKQVKKLKDAKAKEPEPDKRAKPGQQMTLKDTAPKPTPGVEVGTKGQSRKKVALVLAELLRSPDGEAVKIVAESRKEAYPQSALEREYPTLGEEKKDEVVTDLKAQIDQIRAIAGISAAELDQAIKSREESLQKLAAGAKDAFADADKEAKEETKKSGEEAAEKIAGAREAIDEDTIQKMIAATGEADPEVVKLRRDKGLRDLSRRAARQDVYYEKAGERRIKALDASHTRMRNAYKNAAKADQEKIFKKVFDEAKKAKKTDDEAKKQATTQSESDALPYFQWAARRTEDLKRQFQALTTEAAGTTKTHRDGMKTALESAKGLLRDWAEQKIAEQESWWDQIIRMFREWRQDAADDAAAWEEARNEALRDSLVGDLQMIDDIHAAAASGVNMQAYIQERGLDQAQSTVLQTYFGGDKDAPRDSVGAVAAGMRMRVRVARKPGITEFMKSELMKRPDGEWRQLGKIGNAERPPFNVVGLGSDLHAAMDQWGTDEAKIYTALANLTPVQARAIRAFYQTRYNRSLDDHLKSEMSGAELTRAQALLEGNQTLADVATLREAMSGPGTDEDAIMQVLRNKSAEERAAIVAQYKKQYGVDLNAELKEELDDGWSSHHDYDRAGALMAGDTAKADAIAIDQAMHGGITGAGTDEAGINRIYEQTRTEVEAEAARKGWSTAEMEAEIKRRNLAIEQSYETKYGDPTRKLDGTSGQPSALRAAFKSEMSDAELDLANALADNDIVAADAARIGVEKESFITSDETVNKVLESQYTRARKDAERDKNLDLQFRAEVDALRDKPWSREQWAREREKAKGEVEATAKAQAKLNMSKLENAFDDKYSKFGKGGLQVLIAFNMSGDDQDKAWKLIKQGGVLEPAQEIFYAVNGLGTDVDALKRVLKGKSPAEIEAIRKQWKELYPNEPDLDSRIYEEVGGRDEQDMKWGLEGEPQTLDGKIKRAEQRMNYEKTAYSFGNSFSGEERAFMEEEYKALVEEKASFEQLSLSMPPRRPDESNEVYIARLLDETDALREPKRQNESDDEYATRLAKALSQGALLDKYAYSKESFNLQENYFDRSVEDHRAAVDSLADTVANIAAIVATVIVIAVASFFTAGTGGAAIIAALASAKVAAAAAIAAAAATIASKKLLKGSAYSGQEMGVDAIVGVVDAIASYATAGLGGGLLKSLRAGAPASKLATMAANTKVAGKLAKAAASERLATRVFANALAEGMEGVASTLPSALVGNVLDEKNWAKGNPLTNILGGTLIQTGIGVGLSGGLGGLGGIGKHVDEVADALPSGRKELASGLAENSDLLAKRGAPADRLAAWKGWSVDNPGRPYKEFLDEFDAGILAKEVDDSARHALQREMRGELLSGIPPAQRGQFADVPIHVLSDADFQSFTKSASGKAVVIFENGMPRVILREGADLKALREEGIHLLQSRDPKLAKKFAKIDETRLANWKNLDLDEQLDLYRTKLDIELDAQQRLVKSLDEELAGLDDPALRKSLLERREAALKNFENLKGRLDEVTGITPTERLKIAKGEIDPPQYLDQEPRLFSKTRADEQAKLAKVPPDKQVPSRRLTSRLGKSFDDPEGLASMLAATSRLDSELAKKAAGSATGAGMIGTMRARMYVFVSELIGMAARSKERAGLLLTSSIGFFKATRSIATLAPFLTSAPRIYKTYAKAMLSAEKTLFGNLEKIAASGTFRRSRIPKLASAMDDILDSVEPKRIEMADAFVRDTRDAVEQWNKLQAHLDDVKAGRAADPGDTIRDALRADLDAKIAKLDGYSVVDAKLLGEIKKEIVFEGKWSWAAFRQTMGEDFADPTSFGALESFITKAKHWDAADIGPIRRWAGVMEKLHDELKATSTGTHLQALFEQLSDDANPLAKYFKGKNALDFSVGTPRQKFMLAMEHMLSKFESGYKAGEYDNLRYFLRDAVVAAAMDCPSPKLQFDFLQPFLRKLREIDNASVGEYFAAFRRKIFDGGKARAIQGPLSGAADVKGASRQISGVKEMVDGAIKVPDGVKLPDGTPLPPGRYLVEDKAGKSFDIVQARNYSDRLEKGTLKTADPEEVMGLIYFVEDPVHAGRIVNKLDGEGLDGRILVTTFDENGELCFVGRAIAHPSSVPPPPPPPPADLVKP